MVVDLEYGMFGHLLYQTILLSKWEVREQLNSIASNKDVCNHYGDGAPVRSQNILAGHGIVCRIILWNKWRQNYRRHIYVEFRNEISITSIICSFKSDPWAVIKWKSVLASIMAECRIFDRPLSKLISIHFVDAYTQQQCMMTSSNRYIFRVTGHLCGEFTVRRWIPRTKASDAKLWCFLWTAHE